SWQRVWVYSRRRRTGVVLSPQLGAGQLRPAERRPARELRGGTLGEGAAGRKRPQRRLSDAALTTLVLFDIDGTLVLTGGAGGRAMTRAFQELFAIDDAFRDVPMPGRTDTAILGDAAAACGVPGHSPDLARFPDVYC